MPSTNKLLPPETLDLTEDESTLKPEGDTLPVVPEVPPDDPRGATLFAASGDLGDTLPFRRGASASSVVVEGWTVERYASLCVDLEREDQRRAGVLERYGLDEAKRQALERQWNDHFAASTRLARLFLKARAQYLEWLAEQK